MNQDGLAQRAVVASLVLAASSAAANAVGWKTQMSCASDYYAYCAKFSVGTPEVRACMRANGQRLSKGCVNALIADGEISKAEVAQQKEKIAAGKAKPKPVEVAATEKSDAKPAVKTQPEKIAAVPPERRSVPSAKSKAEKLAVDAAKTGSQIPKAALPLPKAPRPAPRAPEAGVQSPAALSPQRAELSLNQMTYEALKVRGSRFLVTDDSYVRETPPVLMSAARGEPQLPQSKTAARQSVPAMQPLAPADDALAFAPDEPPARATAYPEGRMSLGGERERGEGSARKLPLAQDPLGWWQNFWRAVTGQTN